MLLPSEDPRPRQDAELPTSADSVVRDHQAWVQLWDYLCKYLVAVRVPLDLAEDLTMDVIVKLLLRNRSTLRHLASNAVSNVEAYLKAMARKTHSDHHRKERKNKQEFGPEQELECSVRVHRASEIRRRLEELLQATEEAINQLPPDSQQLIQRLIDGATTAEMANEMGIHPTNVLRRKSKVMDQIRRIVEAIEPRE